MGGRLPRKILVTKDKTNNIKKIKKRILAISIDIISTPENPRNPAINAKTKKDTIKCNILTPLLFKKINIF